MRRSFQPWVRFAIWWAALSALYGVLIGREIRRTLWYDELITFYIAKAPTLRDLMYLMRRWDLNPPTLHLLTRVSMALAGAGPVGTRLPSVIEFYLASLLLFAYAQRKLGVEYAAVSILLLWYSPFFQYATEARSYALLVMFFSALLLCWDAAASEGRPRSKWAPWGVAAASTGAVLSHVFAPVALMPFWLAEAVRGLKRRKADYPVWAALAVPMIGVFAYLPFVHSYSALIYPVRFQAGPRKVAAFFWHAIPGLWLKALIGAASVVFCVRAVRFAKRPRRVSATEVVFFATLLAEPLILNLVLMWGHGAFWDRYSITAVLGLCILVAGLFGAVLHFSRFAGRLLAAGFFCLILVQRVPHPLYDSLTSARVASKSTVLSQIEPGLPLVSASGLTFVEMNHNESATLLKRLYYLTDSAAAIHYAHANLFESLDEMKHDFGLAGTVEPYNRFVQQHRCFLVLGTPGYPEDWLLERLAKDGASMVRIADYKLPYKDSSLYEVALPARAK